MATTEDQTMEEATTAAIVTNGGKTNPESGVVHTTHLFMYWDVDINY